MISVGHEDAIETLNLQNLEAPANMARDHAIDNAAAAADMPAILLKSDTLTQGFGEGGEDSKQIAEYVDSIRQWLDQVYRFCDLVTMHRAWTPDFFETLQNDFPEEYGKKDFKTAFYAWKNSFSAEWPSLLTEPDSEKIKVDEIRYKAALGLLESLLPQCDPDNKARLIEWAADVFNEQKLLFPKPLMLDAEALAAFTPEVPGAEEEPEHHENFADSAAGKVKLLQKRAR